MRSLQLNKSLVTYLATSVVLLAALFLAAVPHPASALSCLNPTEMIPMFVSDDSYTIALIEGGALETEGETHDQEVTVLEVYKGELSANATVSFTYNQTWSYMCAGGPADVGSEALYIIRDNQVTQVFTADSELAQTLLAELGEPTTPTEAPVTVEEEERTGLMNQIIALLQQIISFFGGSTEVITEEPVTVTSYIGLTAIEAADYAERQGDLFRVVEIDGEPQAVTKDYREGRINAIVQNNIVTSYTVEGLETQPVEEPTPAKTDDYIGLTVEQAQALAETNGVAFRIGMLDGEPLPVTMDYRPGRITASVVDDVVVDYSVEGEVEVI
jgi:ABC-type amino acid transport substrate-binding protein